jgi:hypothetical protein
MVMVMVMVLLLLLLLLMIILNDDDGDGGDYDNTDIGCDDISQTLTSNSCVSPAVNGSPSLFPTTMASL